MVEPTFARYGNAQRAIFSSGRGGQLADSTWHTIDSIAASQLGLVTRQQLVQAGISKDTIAARVRVRRLHIVHRGVYRVGPLTAPRSRELAAVLACAPDAVLSHVSAAVLWDLVADPGNAEPVHVTVAYDRGRRPGIKAHRSLLKREEVTRKANLPVTTPGRTLLDLSLRLPRRDLEQALARAERKNILDRDAVIAMLDRNPKRAGAAVLRGLLNHGATPALTRSEAEERMLALVRKAQLPAPVVNVPVGHYEVDFLWRSERLVVEVDGFAFHSSRRQFESDRRRDAWLTARGLRIMRVTWRQITTEPEAVLVRLAQALLH